jgi:hypothetical protein
MARGVSTIAETQADAEAQVDAEKYEVRILSCREIDLGGLPPLQKPLPRHWVVVVEDLTPELAAQRPQHENPEEECERATRQMYLAMATDPELPSARERPHPGHFSCPHCRAHLQLAVSGRRWEVAPPSEKRDGRCIFCGAKANSKEHVIPEWISKQLGIKQVISMEGSIQPGQGRAGARSPSAAIGRRSFAPAATPTSSTSRTQ